MFGKKPVVELKVDGMTCGHCVQHVTEALEKAPGVKKAEVSLEKGLLHVVGREGVVEVPDDGDNILQK